MVLQVADPAEQTFPFEKTATFVQEHVGNQAHIRYVGGRRGAWPAPREVSDLAEDAREPALLVTQENQLSLVWRQVDVIAHRVRSLSTGAWSEIKPLVSNPLGLAGPSGHCWTRPPAVAGRLPRHRGGAATW